MNLNFNLLRKKPVVKLVSSDFLMSLGQDHPNTPDYYELEKSKFQLLFVADEMMTGCRYNGMVDNEKGMRYGVAYTQDHFKMVKKNLGKATYPVILPKTANMAGLMNRTELAPIKGELYIVESPQLVELDKYKNNGTVFRRVRIDLDIPYRKVREHRRDVVVNVLSDPMKPGKQTIESVRTLGRENVKVYDAEWEHFKDQDAWMYVADPEYFFWNNYQEALQPVKLIRPADRNLKPFYFYSSKEDAK